MHTWFDEGVFDAPHAEAFRSHLSWLKQHGDPISEQDLLDSIYGKRALPKRAFMITFDDGYRDNYTIAAPILKELAVPGLFFIPTEPIIHRNLGWWDLIAWCLKRTQLKTIHFRGKDYIIGSSIKAADYQLKQDMKLQAAYENEEFILDLAKACQVELPDRSITNQELLSWDDIREMKKLGMGIGSHTHSHRVLATLSLEEQRDELEKSKRIIESEIGSPVHSFAYPVGGYEHFHQETIQIVQEVGYKMAFSYLTGVNRVGKLEPHDIRRISAAETYSELLGSIALPRLFGRRRCAFDRPKPYNALLVDEKHRPARVFALNRNRKD